MHTKLVRCLFAAMVVGLLIPAAVADDARGAAQQTDGPDLAAVRRATAPFHNLETAKAAGYPADATGCLAFPDGYMEFGPGAMSTHWINWDYFRDGGVLDPTKPEALLYEPRADGSLRLVAVEYVIPESDLPRTAPPPVLFGRELRFHPDFSAWAVHVWLWKHNPYGIFADVNPNVTCEFADQTVEARSHVHH